MQYKVMDPWVVGSPARVHKSRRSFINKTLEFLLLFSFSFFLYSYFSGFPFFFSFNIQLSTFIFPFFARALDRKYMFLVCNGILAFLAKNLKYSSSRLNYAGIIETDEDGLKQITKLQTVEENIASTEYAPEMTAAQEEEETEQQPEKDYGDIHNGAKEMKVEGITLENEEWEDDEEEDDDEEELKESKDVEGSQLMEDASVSTEELNQKFEEFIRKMKEEIRIEAQ